MEFVTKPGEVVKLENGKLYQIFQHIEHDSKAYVVLREVFETEDEAYDFEKHKFEYAEEVVEDDDFYLIPVEDKNLINELSKQQ